MVIVATIISTAIVNSATDAQITTMERTQLLNNLKLLSTGCDKDWMDDVFGKPIFTNSDGTTKEYVYITDIALIRSFFDLKDNSCKMFFLTKTTDEPLPFTSLLTNIFYNTGLKPTLGTLTYDQIKNGNLYIFDLIGYFTNGSGRSFYGEGYISVYTMYGENTVYFASVDYGCPSSWDMMEDIHMGQLTEKEKNYYKEFLAPLTEDVDVLDQPIVLHERNKFYPNTYGMSELSGDYTMEKLSDYTTFNSTVVLN